MKILCLDYMTKMILSICKKKLNIRQKNLEINYNNIQFIEKKVKKVSAKVLQTIFILLTLSLTLKKKNFQLLNFGCFIISILLLLFLPQINIDSKY